MNKLGFPGMRSLDQIRSLSKPLLEEVKASAVPIPRPSSSDTISYVSFATLKLTAEKLVKEQALVKTDLEMAHTKLIKASEQIHVLEAKWQEAVNETAKLRAKQTEDSKLWKGLDSKFSSTKTLCDQLTETLQQLAGQTRKAEEGKKFFEEKISNNSKAFEDFNCHINDLSAKLESAGNTIRTGEQKVLELRHEKEEMERTFRDEQCTTNNVIKEKDSLITQLQDAISESKRTLQDLEFQLYEVQHELASKEDICICLRGTQEVLEREKNELQCQNTDLGLLVDRSVKEIKGLEDLVRELMAKVVELDKEASVVSGHFAQFVSSYGNYYNLVQQEKDLASKSSQGKMDKLHLQLVSIGSENDAFRAEIKELKEKIMDLQKAQEFSMVQHADECRFTEDTIHRLETEVEVLVSKKNESEKLAADLGQKVKDLLEASSQTENEMQVLLQKIASLESENQNLVEKVQSALQERAEEAGALREEILKRDQHTDSLETQISELRSILNEKEQFHISFMGKEKQLEEQKSEVMASLAAAECKLTEDKKQFDEMLERKQLELSKHLKELSQRNDQAINEIRRKYEEEKVEIASAEKEKADKLIKEMEQKCADKILQQKEEAEKYLMHVKEEHGAMISKIQQDHDQNELNLRALQKEEIQRIQLHSENDLREKTSSLRKEHEIQMKVLKMQHEDDCRRLEDELELQKSKEEKQRALLQMQWRVMSENKQDDQEVNSKKEYSASSIKKDLNGGKEHRLALTSPETRRKDVHMSGLMRTPRVNLLKMVEKGNTGSVVSIPKHSKKVTRHEYEVETSNGKTITKRRKTKSTVMFGDPNLQKAVRTRTPNASREVNQVTKDPNLQKAVRTRTPNASREVNQVTKVPGRGAGSRPGPIGDLFSEGSLNPYTDDPYAFD